MILKEAAPNGCNVRSTRSAPERPGNDMRARLGGTLISGLLLLAGAAGATGLSLEVFVAEPEEINVTSALIMGPTEMMVVCAQATRSSANRLADLIESKDRELRYVFLTHAHLDHSQGAGILLERFPGARFIATPEVGALQRLRIPADDDLASSRYGDNAAIPSIPVEDYAGDRIMVDGIEVRIWKDVVGDAGLGYPDEPHAAIYVPSLHALIPSDVVYFDAHMMTGGSSKESRAQWVAQLESWIGKEFEVVVPGHIPKTSLAALNAQGALTHSRDYLLTYERALATSTSADELIEQMLALYPDMQHQSALRLSAFIEFKETHRVLFNPTLETVASYLPSSFVAWIDEWMLERRRRAANLER